MIESLKHIGTPRHSGRYPWGSGENPQQRNRDFLGRIDQLKKQGLSDKEIYEGMGMNSAEFRARKAVANNEMRKALQIEAIRLKDTGMSNIAIGKQMGFNESRVRSLIDPAMQERTSTYANTANLLKEHMKDGNYLDVGEGTENHLGVSNTNLKTALTILKDEGYDVRTIQVDQVGTGAGMKTTVKVLVPSDVPTREIYLNQDKIKTVAAYSEDGGRTFLGIENPVSVDSKRVGVRYAEDGGASKDGVIELRRNVADISLGNAQYAQVRISVDGTHYLKGMAMYSDNLPDGVDMLFNTNKKNTGNKLDAMKPMKDDEDNPFGSTIRQKHYIDANGKSQLSPLNIVGTHKPDGTAISGEEGSWATWSSKLSSQFLSKQNPTLAKQQLGLTYDIKKQEYDDIMALTNPAIKKKLLDKFADSSDSSAVHLKAAGLPRTANHVILPINSLKDNEIYAPGYNNGEKVVLVRHPHGGTFEIPELTVNNRNPEARSVMNRARDAVGINAKVAERLSGADFDGDTVLVIPNNSRSVKTSPSLHALKDFDPKSSFPAYEGMPKMTPRQKGIEMGNVSNLITDMTIKGANQAEIARAVKHSMVVIDAEKHHLNYKASAKANDIAQLKAKYQGGSTSGASTLISKASSEIKVLERKARSAKDGGKIDPLTGEKVYVETGKSYVKTTLSPKAVKALGDDKKAVLSEVTRRLDGRPPKEVDAKISKLADAVIRGDYGAVKRETSFNKSTTTKMAEAKDARDLMGKTPTVMESIYADHANKLKALANTARKEAYTVKDAKYQPSAKVAYDPQVKSLTAKLNTALKNKPLERQAQLIATSTKNAKVQAKPNMTADELKKVNSQALTEARRRTGAEKTRIDITPEEWNAIQAGAISTNKLNRILDNADLNQVKQYATPRDKPVMNKARTAKAKNMWALGYTQAEIAASLGVPASTLQDTLLT